MKSKIINMDLGKINRVDQFPEIEMKFTVSKEEVWNNLLNELDKPKVQIKPLAFSYYFKIAAAASVLIILGLTGFFRFYTTTVYTSPGQHLSYRLPDNSSVELNAESKIQFHPYWFSFSRTVVLDGEAYFLVSKGKKFSVSSKLGETTVLGTSFNIYSRNSDYTVICYTGKVRVVSTGKKEKVLLNPNEKAFITSDGFLRFVQEANSQSLKSWRDNMFVFTGTPIVTVLQEIERQYNIKIQFQADPGLTYTGYFSRSLSGKEVLDLVCTSLGIKFDAKSDTEFLVN